MSEQGDFNVKYKWVGRQSFQASPKTHTINTHFVAASHVCVVCVWSLGGRQLVHRAHWSETIHFLSVRQFEAAARVFYLMKWKDVIIWRRKVKFTQMSRLFNTMWMQVCMCTFPYLMGSNSSGYYGIYSCTVFKYNDEVPYQSIYFSFHFLLH